MEINPMMASAIAKLIKNILFVVCNFLLMNHEHNTSKFPSDVSKITKNEINIIASLMPILDRLSFVL
jgi:hypothetical protein